MVHLIQWNEKNQAPYALASFTGQVIMARLRLRNEALRLPRLLLPRTRWGLPVKLSVRDANSSSAGSTYFSGSPCTLRAHGSHVRRPLKCCVQSQYHSPRAHLSRRKRRFLARLGGPGRLPWLRRLYAHLRMMKPHWSARLTITNVHDRTYW